MTPEQENEYLKNASHTDLRGYLAIKIRRERRLHKESQEAFAKRAGIALRTYKRLETEGRGHLDTFLKAIVALEKSRYLQLLFPVPSSKTVGNPLEARLATLQEKQRHAGMRTPKP
ncbi:helix-turn-helix domain-containing protein [Laribacter hongkongensis]|uniref:helix-turn-helix domain-containing protein n=1 Tax=Laribacter hongkongensis TaxID=168471 RepID=UPI001EFC5B13|nr:helix-turn-helix transcriptional regulator [Laribacter hongkongensis]MCG8996070.1 helix-turn-helix domain-containing protein [Laribacter hongkongensis]MCG9011001.1 helix-turn-helix domain-containing protein [Laribacter hongkongensis]MCG9023425.1 helix-turn-helix domain-containing protein [Laribacter hongkongensis]MCG9047815.1 helix-turn-helix domain-containing protein [Laribacter hongkongensis]MCG9074841.1 helix-turn-helix domain-containing protein [Laribacter hongkongensis]